MLRRVELTNFRKHTDLTLDLTPGVLVIRASNEGGKTTLIEAIAYAFFGSRACRQPLDEVVTWGKPTNTLKVVIEFEVDGVEYLLKRSKGGAELTYSAGVVTGQTEVTNFIENLLGAPASLATNLWFANQGSIRGALEAGPKATAQLIEQLADFGLIDRIVDLIQTHLPTGQSRPYEERLKQAKDLVNEMNGDVPVPSEEERQAIVNLEEASKEVFSSYEQELAVSKEYDAQTLAPVVQKKQAYDRAVEEAGRTRIIVQTTQQELAGNLIPSFQKAELEAAQAQLILASQSEQEVRSHDAAKRDLALIVDDGNLWEGDQDSYNQFKSELAAKVSANSEELSKLRTALALKTHEIVNSQVCGFCDKDVSELPQVLEKNERLQKETSDLRQKLDELGEESALLSTQTTACRAIDKQEDKVERFLRKHAKWVDIDDKSVPPAIKLKPAPTAVDLSALQKKVAKLEAERKAIEQAVARQELLQKQLAQQTAILERSERELSDLQGDLSTYEEVVAHATSLTEAYVTRKEAYDSILVGLSVRKAKFSADVEAYERQQKNIAAARKMLDDAKTALEELNFNNTLLKKVRASRPLIVDRLWSVVLTAVSYYFTQMRGTESTVTRAEGGFKVSGQAVEGLSGSTLDILGLSIRLALLKTFLPRCNFLVLDEPAAACDDEREGALIGTVATAHFEQVLAVTHSDVMDSFADQLVTL